MPLMLLLVLWPLIEIALFVQIGGAIGLWPTLAVVIGTALLGSWLIRRRGGHAMAEVQRAVGELRDPTAPMARGAIILLAGALLVLPGFLTDALGLLLLVPGVGTGILALAGRRMVTRGRARFATGPVPHRYGQGTVIDADYVDETGRPATPPQPDQPVQPVGPQGGSLGRPSGWTRGPEAH